MAEPILTGITDNFFTFAQRGWTDSLNGSINDSAATITFNSLAGYTDGQSILVWLEPATDNEELVYGIVSGNSIVSAVRGVLGTAAAHSSGAAATEYVSSAHHDLMRKGILVHSNPDGTLKDGAVHSADVLEANVVTTQKVAANAITPAKRSGGFATGTLTLTSTGAKSVTGLSFQPKFLRIISTLDNSDVSNAINIFNWDGSKVTGIVSAARGTSAASRFRNSATNVAAALAMDASGSPFTAWQITLGAFTSDGFTYTVNTLTAVHIAGYEAYG